MQMRYCDDQHLVALNQIDQAVWKLTNPMLPQLCIYLAPRDGKIRQAIKCKKSAPRPGTCDS
jgi:hypothetical protein